MKKHKIKILSGIIIALVLAFVFWYGGNAPSLRGWEPQQKSIEETIESNVPSDNINTVQTSEPEIQDTFENEKAPDKSKIIPEPENKTDKQPKKDTDYKPSKKDKYMTDPVPEGKPLPIEPENAKISNEKLTCTLSVKCDTILNNISWFDEEKKSILPKNGIIFEERTVTFYDGESVFNVLLREMKRNKIHLEFENVPIYNSAYIEGINNIYEFDCGELSGWMYKVNGWFPNYGCSRYQLKDGDKIEWVYTCDWGADVGGHYISKGELNEGI